MVDDMPDGYVQRFELSAEIGATDGEKVWIGTGWMHCASETEKNKLSFAVKEAAYTQPGGSCVSNFASWQPERRARNRRPGR